MHAVLYAGRGRSTASVVQAQEQMRGANDAFLSLDLERLEAMEEAARLRSEIGRLRTAMGGRLVSCVRQQQQRVCICLVIGMV